MQRTIIIPAIALVLFCAILIFGTGESHTNWPDLGWRTLNFACFVGIIWWAAGRKVGDLLRNRRAGIAEDLDGLAQAKRDAEFTLHQLSARIANVDLERDAILAESKAQAEAAKEQILAQARRQADEILAQARRTAESETRNMVRSLRARVADEVTEAVRNQLAERLNPAEHDRLIDNALKKVVIQ